VITIAEMTPTELAGFIGDHLGTRGIDVVLSGGACVAYYSEGKYVSMDLDFVNAASTSYTKIHAAMTELGFQERNRYFTHSDTEYLVEFPSGPLGVGDEQVGEIVEIETRAGTFRIISPTDCVKDRLAAYFHWNDLPCFEQAVMVARENKIDFVEVERWSENEGKADLFQRFLKRLDARD
jgi:hypothetical protein